MMIEALRRPLTSKRPVDRDLGIYGDDVDDLLEQFGSDSVLNPANR